MYLQLLQLLRFHAVLVLTQAVRPRLPVLNVRLGPSAQMAHCPTPRNVLLDFILQGAYRRVSSAVLVRSIIFKALRGAVSVRLVGLM